MPFAKGREKTGGRVKGGKVRKSTKLVDQLKDYGFNYPKELAQALKDLPAAVKYAELKQLLPFMSPKLREREVELVDKADEVETNQKPITDDDLIKVMSNGPEPKSRASRPAPVATRDIELQAAPSTETNLHDMAQEQKDNQEASVHSVETPG